MKNNKSKKFKIFGCVTLAFSVALIAASNILAVASMPIVSLSCLGAGLCFMITAYALKTNAQNLEQKQEKFFAPFPDPNGIKIEEYTNEQQQINTQESTQSYNSSKIIEQYKNNNHCNQTNLEK